LTPKTPGTPLAAGVPVTLTVRGNFITAGDTQVFGLGAPVTLTSATGTVGSVDIVLPTDYKAGMQVHLASAANPSITSATIPTSSGP